MRGLDGVRSAAELVLPLCIARDRKGAGENLVAVFGKLCEKAEVGDVPTEFTNTTVAVDGQAEDSEVDGVSGIGRHRL